MFSNIFEVYVYISNEYVCHITFVNIHTSDYVVSQKCKINLLLFYYPIVHVGLSCLLQLCDKMCKYPCLLGYDKCNWSLAALDSSRRLQHPRQQFHTIHTHTLTRTCFNTALYTDRVCNPESSEHGDYLHCMCLLLRECVDLLTATHVCVCVCKQCERLSMFRLPHIFLVTVFVLVANKIFIHKYYKYHPNKEIQKIFLENVQTCCVSNGFHIMLRLSTSETGWDLCSNKQAGKPNSVKRCLQFGVGPDRCGSPQNALRASTRIKYNDLRLPPYLCLSTKPAWSVFQKSQIMIFQVSKTLNETCSMQTRVVRCYADKKHRTRPPASHPNNIIVSVDAMHGRLDLIRFIAVRVYMFCGQRCVSRFMNSHNSL